MHTIGIVVRVAKLQNDRGMWVFYGFLHDEGRANILDGPRRREAAGGHDLKDQVFGLNQKDFIGSFCLLGANARAFPYQ